MDEKESVCVCVFVGSCVQAAGSSKRRGKEFVLGIMGIIFIDPRQLTALSQLNHLHRHLLADRSSEPRQKRMGIGAI